MVLAIDDSSGDELSVIMEATGPYFWIFDTIAAMGHDVKVVHPNKAKHLVRERMNDNRNDE